MSATTLTLVEPAANRMQLGWLFGRSFDLVFIVGVAALALGTAAVLWWRPGWFSILLLLDLWLLGYHHVVATYARLAVEDGGFRRNWFLIFVLPVVVLAATAAAGLLGGAWLLTTIYFFWQWYHYTRQSYGIARGYRRKARSFTSFDEHALSCVIYGLPVAGILYRSFEGHDFFLNMPMVFPPVPWWLAAGSAVVAVITVLVWIGCQWRAWREQRFSLALNLFLTTHLLIYFVSYFLIPSLDRGWLVINVWHNAQYLLFVWAFNVKSAARSEGRNLSWQAALCQTKPLYIGAYFLSTMLVTLAVYGSLAFVASNSFIFTIPAGTLIIYQTINFHHYLVDAVIWQSKRQARATPPAVVTPAIVAPASDSLLLPKANELGVPASGI